MSSDLFTLKGKTAIVTGAGSGLGEGIAKAYADQGARVMLVDINEAALTRVMTDINGTAEEKCEFAICDVADPDAVRATVEKTLAAFGKIDILFNIAGIGRRANAEQMTDEEWHAVININLAGPFHFCREVGRHMIERGEGGRVINMASITALVGVETGNANYAASKGGLVAMTRCLAIEWAGHNILVNAIAPTHVRTPLIEKLMQDKPEVGTYFLNNIPLGRLGEISDITGPAVFLASDAAGFITGHVLVVDGGHTAR